jgi:hypothetical protein
MLARLPFGRPSHATVVAYLALFVALGGTSAVALSGSNTVFSDDIADDTFNSPSEGQGGLVASDLRAGSVTGSEVADSSLTGNDVFDNTIGGADVTNSSLTGADIATNSVSGVDIINLTGLDVINGTLNDEDIAKGTFVDFTADIGVVPARDCVERFVSGVDAQGDHLLLTPEIASTERAIIYSATYARFSELAAIQACNPTNADIDEGLAVFNLLVIGA